MSPKDKTPEAPKAMDDSIREESTGTTSTNHVRICGAIKQLVAEVHSLFPETPVEYSDYDGRNTALSAEFDLSSMGGDSVLLNNLLDLIASDERVGEVLTEDFDQAYVLMKSSLRTQDTRDSFNLADAWSVMSADDDEFPEENTPWDWENGAGFTLEGGSQ